MGVKVLSAMLCASLSLASPSAIAQPAPSAPATISQVPESAIATDDLSTNEMLQLAAQWLLAIGLTVGSIAIALGVYRYNRNETWHRIEFLRKAVKEFEQDPEIWKALKILDFEEYRDYELAHQGQTLTFRVNNEMLTRALATHNDRKNRQKEADKGELSDEELKDYLIETGLRDWFNKMLNGLEHFGYFVESGMFTADEIRPWMIYWIRLIADRAYKRQDASKFYDQLYTYIHTYGFSGVIKLFEQFGYRILPTPYDESDFKNLSKGLEGFDLQTALSLAKAAYLIYGDLNYVKEISLKRWEIGGVEDFQYFNNRERDTQAFMFKSKDFVVLAFRGSQEFKDWQTNISTRFNKFAIRTQMEPLEEDITPPRGFVHRGFQAAWQSVEGDVIKQLRVWNAGRKDGLPLFITGHSLGGALATVASGSLVKQGFRNIQGVYTFGQPRVGDLIFVGEINSLLKGRVFRFVNNNDIVPRIPPPYLPWNPFRIYIHLGQIKYFNVRGQLIEHSNPAVRLLDLAIGLFRDAFKPGLDMVNDHRMEFYISNLKKALDVEREEQALNER